MRQVMLADNDFDIDAKIVRAAQDFDHAAAGGARGRWPSRYFDVDHQTFQIPACKILHLSCPGSLFPENAMRRSQCGSLEQGLG